MTALSRRTFLKTSTAFSGLAILVSQSPARLMAKDLVQSATVGPCLRFSEAGRAILCVPMPDMGQGMMTTAAQLIAEELDLDLKDVSVEYMPFDGKIDENGRAIEGAIAQSAGGSHSTMLIWSSVREAAALARTLFVEAAAARLNVPASALDTEAGSVIHRATKRTISYRDLLDDAQTVELGSTNVRPKPLDSYKVIGADAKNVASYDIVTGKPIFGIDIDVPGMLHAVIRRCPHLNGRVRSYDADQVASMPGVKAVIKMDRHPADMSRYRIISDGVAVIADTYWNARKAADTLDIEWDGERASGDSTDRLLNACRQLLDDPAKTMVVDKGDIASEIASAEHVVEATYTHPAWAHTNIEPHNCIAHVKGNSAEIWVGHQNMTKPANVTKEFAGIDPANVKAHFYRMGTGFGRKSEDDYIAEAVILSQKLDAPVKVTWSREDEIEQDYPNHLGAYRVRAAVDSEGQLSGWHMTTALDTRRDWVARDFPITAIDHARGEAIKVPSNITLGPWRGPSHNTAAWVIQSALSEAAYAAGRDPYDFLKDLYMRAGTIQSPNWPRIDIDYTRHAELLSIVAEMADYGKKMPEGWGQGIAVHHTFVGTCAHVVDVEMLGEHDFRVHRVNSAIDCGLAVNPLGVRAQVEGGIIDGLCAAKYGKLRFEKGVPVTNNFDSYRKMRIDESPPVINVHILDKGDREPKGTGEIALPPVIPALTNAIFAASGKRIRSLPISENL